MKEKKLEYRMYGLVNYQLTPMQAGIQFGHATDEFAGKVIDALQKNPNDCSGFVKNYIKWNSLYKTVIVLNGGTTNNNPERLGTLNQYYEQVRLLNVFVVPFYEPDLGDQMTSFAFLLDERVYDKIKYPDFVFVEKQIDRANPVFSIDVPDEKERWIEWLNTIGGIQNNLMREFIRPLALAK